MFLSMGAPLGGALSFRALGLFDLLPVALRPTVKWMHKKVTREDTAGEGAGEGREREGRGEGP